MATDQIELDNRQRRRGSRYYNPQGIGMFPQGGSDYYQRRNTEIEQGLMPPAQPDAGQSAGAATLEQMQAQQQAQVVQATQEGKQRDEQFQFASKTGTLVPGLNFSQFSTKPTSTISQGGIMTPETAQGLVSAHHTNAQLKNMSEQSARQVVNAEPTPGTMRAANEQVSTDMGVANENEQVLRKERDRQWDEQLVAFEEQKRADTLGLGQAHIAEAQFRVAKEAKDYAEQERMRPVKEAKALADLEHAKNENVSQEMKQANIQRIQNQIAAIQQPQQPPVNAATDHVVAATSSNQIKLTFDQIKNVAALHGIPNEIRDNTYLGSLAGTYPDGAPELAADVGAKPVEGLQAVSMNKVRGFIPDIKAEFAKKSTPDVALENLLKESGLKKSDNGYSQRALELAAGILNVYSEAGDVAAINSGEIIGQSRANARNKIISSLAPIVQRANMAEHVKEIISEDQQARDKALALSKSGMEGSVEEKAAGAQLESATFQAAGLPDTKKDWSAEKIITAHLHHLIDLHKNDPQIVSELSRYLDPNERIKYPAINQALNDIVPQFQSGYKNVKAEETKVQSEQDGILAEARKNDPTTEIHFEPGSAKKLVEFHGPDALAKKNAYELASPGTRKGMEDAERRKIVRDEMIVGGTPAWKRFIESDAPGARRMQEIHDLVETGNLSEEAKAGISLELETKHHISWETAQSIDKQYQDYHASESMQAAAGGQVATEVERQTPDGRTAIFDSNTKQFIRYK